MCEGLGVFEGHDALCTVDIVGEKILFAAAMLTYRV